MNIRITRVRVALATAVLGVVVAGASYAAIPAANGTISACKDSKGALKVIDVETGQACASNQSLLTWNQQGPAGPQGPAGAQGPAGPQGAQGLQGPQGAAGVSGYQIVYADSASNDTEREKEVTAHCPAGKRPISGGHLLTDAWIPDDAYTLSESRPAGGLLPGWTVRVTYTGLPGTYLTTWSVRAYAVCAIVG